MKTEIELLLLKLADGGRVLRISEPESGLCLEKRLDAKAPVAQQTAHWRQSFLQLIEREFGSAS